MVKEQTLNIRVVQKWGGKIVLRNVRFLENQYGRQITSHTLVSTGPWLFVVFFSPSRQKITQCIEFSHERFLTHAF